MNTYLVLYPTLHQEITDFLADEHLLRVKAFIGQGNGSGGKARAAAEVAKMKAAFRKGGVGIGGVVDEDGGVGSDGEDPLAAKPRLKGQTQKEQKVWSGAHWLHLLCSVYWCLVMLTLFGSYLHEQS